MATKKLTMHHFFGNPYYRGKHILLVAGKAFTSKTGTGISKILDKVRIKYPKDVPELAYIRQRGLLIVLL